MAINTGFGAFTPTSNVWDLEQLLSLDVDPKLKELLIRLYQNLNLMALVINIKDSGYYIPQEFVNGQMLFPDPNKPAGSTSTPPYRQVYRIVIQFGALPNGTMTPTKSVPHNLTINSSWVFTRIYGVANDPVAFSYLPLPYASATGANIELFVDATNVTIVTTAVDYSAYTNTLVVLEYCKF